MKLPNLLSLFSFVISCDERLMNALLNLDEWEELAIVLTFIYAALGGCMQAPYPTSTT